MHDPIQEIEEVISEMHARAERSVGDRRLLDVWNLRLAQSLEVLRRNPPLSTPMMIAIGDLSRAMGDPAVLGTVSDGGIHAGVIRMATERLKKLPR